MMRQESKLGFLDIPLDEVVVVGKEQLQKRKSFFIGCPSFSSRENDSAGDCSLSIKRHLTWMRNNASYLIFTCIFFCTNIALFLKGAYDYRHTNYLIMGARACGQCLNLDCVLLLTLILRRSITKLRNSKLGKLFPCDRHVQFHKMAGWSVFFLSILHSVFHIVNFAKMSEQTGIEFMTYLVDTSLGIGWVGGLANPTGIILVLILIIIVSFSHRCVRKSGYFEVFYWTHLLSLPFWIFLILHGPCFWKWLLIPGSAFVIEFCLRVAQVCSPRGKSSVVSATELPSQVIKLVIKKPENFEFRAGEYVYLNIPSVAGYEWHPFTISSAPEEDDVFTVHIRAVGGWTRRVHQMFSPKPQKKESQAKDIPTEKPKRKQGILNPTFIPPIMDEEHGQERKFSTGNRYMSNLIEFNRKMSNVAMPAILMVETEKKLVERKRSSSLSSLTQSGVFYHQLLYSGSGNSSLTGSQSSLRSRSESESSTFDKESSSDSKGVEIYVDGPYGSPSSRIFNVSHAVLVGAGIGVTPFASILQSVMHRYKAAKYPCPHCNVSSCLALPATLRKLRKVDFVWVNRDISHFEWFLELLANLEAEQSVTGAAMEKFLRLHLYKTGSEPIEPSIPLAANIQQGRPDWDKVLSEIRETRVGRVCVFYCGPPSLAGVMREKCRKYRLDFSREMF